MKPLPFRSPYYKLTLLSVLHLVTDGLCSFLIFFRLYPENPERAILVFFIYNILAFVTQSPVGALIDKFNKPKIFLSVSMALMLLGYLFSGVWLLSVICIGISNSLFHVAGGRYVTDKSGNDISHLGIFVSTGAIGLVLGQRYLEIIAMPYIFFALLLICGLLFIFSEDCGTKECGAELVDEKWFTCAILAVVAVVAIRSFVGKVVTPDFTPEGHIFLFISLATALGKAMGGVFSKLFGIRSTTLVSMLIAAICLTVGTANPILFILGVFAFNFSMPITLYYANVMMKGSEGFAFGTLAASLIPGYFLAMSFKYSSVMRGVVAILCIVSMLTIIIVSKRIRNDAQSINVNHNN